MPRRRAAALLLGLALGVTGCQISGGDAALPEGQVSASPTRPAVTTTKPAPTKAPTSAAPTPARTPVLLFPRSGGDGDSWKDRAGVEYRLGLVNTPELNECYGNTAATARKRLTKPGFTAKSYTTDDFGRRVSVVLLADGRNLNVLLAREGYADDRYLTQFRSENPSLAAQLDVAFAAARKAKAGLWGACSVSTVPQGIVGPGPAPTPAPTTDRAGCDAAYPTVCIPSPEPDLDCGDITFRRFTVLAPDPHRFDGPDDDGIGCESG